MDICFWLTFSDNFIKLKYKIFMIYLHYISILILKFKIVKITYLCLTNFLNYCFYYKFSNIILLILVNYYIQYLFTYECNADHFIFRVLKISI